MNRQYIQMEIGNLARVCSKNAQGLGHYTPTPPLGASNGITLCNTIQSHYTSRNNHTIQHAPLEVLGLRLSVVVGIGLCWPLAAAVSLRIVVA